MNIFFGKISDKIDKNQIEEGYYLAPFVNKDSSINDIKQECSMLGVLCTNPHKFPR